MKISVIIPVHDPDADLSGYIESLIQNKIEDIVIAADSEDISAGLYEKPAAAESSVTFVRAKKKGRGAALKAAFKFVQENRPDTEGVLCLPAEENCPFEALSACISAFNENPDHIIIGKRDFEGRGISGLKKIGIKFSSFIYSFGAGIKLSDTQSSLRLIPAGYLKYFTGISGDAAGYETRMLFAVVNNRLPYKEVSTGILYRPHRAEKGFAAFKKKIVIYGIVLAYFVKFALSSVSSYLIDMGLYAVLLAFLRNVLAIGSQVLVCTVVSRVISSLFNYIINRKTVFKSTDNLAATTVKYYALVIVKLAVSYGLIYLFTYILNVTGFAQLIIKALVDLALFVFSYYFQRIWVFKNKKT